MTFVLESISLSVGQETVIDDVSLTLDQGSMNVLLGPTLSGKTTLMRLMAGLDHPMSGRVIEGGVDVTNVPVRRRSVAMVYQQFVNYPSLTVYENVASPLRVAGVGRAEIDGRVNEAARLLRLDNLLQRLPAQLSGGQQQRTAIARALVKRAKLVLLDEPLANLDYKLRAQGLAGGHAEAAIDPFHAEDGREHAITQRLAAGALRMGMDEQRLTARGRGKQALIDVVVWRWQGRCGGNIVGPAALCGKSSDRGIMQRA